MIRRIQFTFDSEQALHPRRAGIGDALVRAFPLPGHDKADQEERHILRREELRQAVKRDR